MGSDSHFVFIIKKFAWLNSCYSVAINTPFNYFIIQQLFNEFLPLYTSLKKKI